MILKVPRKRTQKLIAKSCKGTDAISQFFQFFRVFCEYLTLRAFSLQKGISNKFYIVILNLLINPQRNRVNQFAPKEFRPMQRLRTLFL